MIQNDRRARSSGPDVLIVDDEDDIRELLELTLLRLGLASDGAATLAEARGLLAEKRYRLCLTDMRLPDGDGLELVRHIAENIGDLPVAVITAFGSMDNAVTALKAGAFDYLSKPVSIDQLRALVKSVFSVPAKEDAGRKDTSSLIGESQAMVQVRSLIEKLSRSQAPVFISGESGSGKERAARMIHELGPRAAAPFVAVNCGAIPENLMESEFFGARKGAFTGADSDREGFFQAAHGGTLFLDEVGDLPLPMQVKLLRAIQEKKFRRLGDTVETTVDVRILSATHQNLKAMVEAARFRQDLFYRLNVIELRMPALRERSEDIPALAETLLARLAESSGLPVARLGADAVKALVSYSFPGNVRELENILERALALSSGSEIRADDLLLDPADMGEASPATPTTQGGAHLQDFLDEVERHAIEEALEKSGGNRTAAARALGVTFRSLRYRLERLGMKE
ncbi:sigma-54 dependent transcriptional regulator [Zoogloea sp.]|jgi:two-component system response regulator PilR (NtrC family)|uniref:sigma-54-dependent transcriptional regulator n=1 Tax=Zoogloea sp. TaxID=49181 RepID=UPI0011DAE1B1|nr:sigma-54 dependent transcriptional regulator [Zoogloea sp.]TXG87219.1 MAG: sigma-54-dependent Fis family transcriptional regulator [Zoogloea sp.]HPI59028.1 sigma-54 dependent transcriptional regulator [Zoogloea sp.]